MLTDITYIIVKNLKMRNQYCWGCLVAKSLQNFLTAKAVIKLNQKREITKIQKRKHKQPKKQTYASKSAMGIMRQTKAKFHDDKDSVYLLSLV